MDFRAFAKKSQDIAITEKRRFGQKRPALRACALLALAGATLALGACPSRTRITRLGLPVSLGTVVRGLASWYGPRYHGRTTASGERFDQHAMTAAHRRWALGTFVKVTHLGNGHSVLVRINDRGPFVDGVLLDLSREAARRLRMLKEGRALVACEVVPPPTDPALAAETVPRAELRRP